MMTDPIAAMLTAIRNAAAVTKPEVLIPYARLKAEIARILLENGYIAHFQQVTVDNKPLLEIALKYSGGQSVITGLHRVSKPSRRLYAKKDRLPIVRNNHGIAILSTSQGLMTNKQAKQAGLGGEVLCEVY